MAEPPDRGVCRAGGGGRGVGRVEDLRMNPRPTPFHERLLAYAVIGVVTVIVVLGIAKAMEAQ